MKPYYEDDCVTIYHADALTVPVQDILYGKGQMSTLITDPPYGIGYKSGHNTGHKKRRPGWDYRRDSNFAPIVGDDRAFDPKPWLEFQKVALFGGIHFARSLPDSRGWITWDKREDSGSDLQADCEFVWTNQDKPARIFRHLWRGLVRKGEENVARSPKLHPHQKPIALMRYIIGYLECGEGDVICDPFMGSGTTIRAAKDLGIPAIGVEIEERYCELAAKRMLQEVLLTA